MEAGDRAILLVEDNPDDEELTRLAFAEASLANRLDVARDGVEALEYLHGITPAGAPAHPLPMLVLLDLKLPRIDGLEVLRRLRAEPRTALLPVVILTTSVEEQDLLRSYASGANSYVRKPIDFGEFVHAVQQLGLYWLVLNQPAPARS